MYERNNDHGEWAVRVEPDRLQIDAYHDRAQPHAHDPRDYRRVVPLVGLTLARTRRVLVAHLERHDGIRFAELLGELME